MSDSPGASDETPEAMFVGAPGAAEIRTYILDMVAQLAQMAAFHGQHDLAAFLANAPPLADAAPPGAAIN